MRPKLRLILGEVPLGKDHDFQIYHRMFEPPILYHRLSNLFMYKISTRAIDCDEDWVLLTDLNVEDEHFECIQSHA